MSILDEKWELSQQAQEFFVYATLGIVPKEIFNKGNYVEIISEFECFKRNEVNYTVYCIFKCARAAYNDLCRTLRYDAKYKSDSKDKKALKEKEKIINCICATLTKAIYNDGNIVANAEKLFNVFNVNGNNKKLMSALLKCLSVDKKTKQRFHFGQVQKWVNMTLKYLYLLGIVKDDKDIKVLQIPVDSYILKALSEESGIKQKTNSAWSRFDSEDYYNIYDDYKDTIDKPYIHWEHDAWIKQAEKEKEVEITDK